MATTPTPQKRNWFGNIVDFFFGTTRSTKRTLICFVVLIVLWNIDSILLWFAETLNKIAAFIAALLSAWGPLIFIIVVILFFLRKKPSSKK